MRSPRLSETPNRIVSSTGGAPFPQKRKMPLLLRGVRGVEFILIIVKKYPGIAVAIPGLLVHSLAEGLLICKCRLVVHL